jgi:exosome complex component RRP41
VEKTGGTPELVAAVLPATEEVVLLQLERKLPLENLAPVMELAVAGCQQVYRVLREQVKTHSLALKANALAE